MVADATLQQPLFAPPRITAEAADTDGAIMLRSAQPLGEYPVSVVHSVREWARGQRADQRVPQRAA